MVHSRHISISGVYATRSIVPIHIARLYGQRARLLTGRGGETEQRNKYRHDKCRARCRPEVLVNYVRSGGASTSR